jgi:hypothetical protein
MYEVEYLQQCKLKFEPPKHKREILQCANCERYGHTKTIATNQDASNALVIILQSSANVKKDPVMFDVSFVAEIISRITRDV